MAAPLLLAIDQGTSATKCLLVSGQDGTVVARASSAIGETHPQPGWVEQNPDEIWDSVRRAVDAALDAHNPKAVAAIGLSVQRESTLIWDRRTRAALSPLLSWQDQRTAAARRALSTPEVEKLVRARSGLPLDPMFSALKAKWLLDTYDPRREKAKAGAICIGTVDSWILSRLADDPVIETGMASRTQLMDVHRVDWDDELLALFDIPKAALPRIAPSVGPFPPSRGLSPLPDGVPVGAVMGDSHAALFAHGAFSPGQVKATYGTGSSVMGLVAEADKLDPGLCLTIGWALEKPAYAAEGNIRATGAALKWMAEFLEMTPMQLAELAVDASSNGVSFVPGFTGLGAPWWDPNAVGLLTGLTLGTTRRDVARATLEAIPHQVADVLDAVHRSVGVIQELYVDGGPTRNDSLVAAQADLIGSPVLRANDAELSALGVAHMAGLGAGIWSIDDLGKLPRSRDRFEPRLTANERATRRMEWHRALARSRGAAVD